MASDSLSCLSVISLLSHFPPSHHPHYDTAAEREYGFFLFDFGSDRIYWSHCRNVFRLVVFSFDDVDEKPTIRQDIIAHDDVLTWPLSPLMFHRSQRGPKQLAPLVLVTSRGCHGDGRWHGRRFVVAEYVHPPKLHQQQEQVRHVQGGESMMMMMTVTTTTTRRRPNE
jgi:hypothetical protein